jgi:transposase-like protein
VVLREALSSENTPFQTLINQGKDTLTTAVRPASPQVTEGKDYHPNKQLSPSERAKLTEQYQLGLSVIELARQYGIHKHTVAKHLKHDAVVLRGGRVKLAPDVIKQAAHMYESGNSLAQIGAHLGVDPSGIHKALKKAGVKLRDTHGRPT